MSFGPPQQPPRRGIPMRTTKVTKTVTTTAPSNQTSSTTLFPEMGPSGSRTRQSMTPRMPGTGIPRRGDSGASRLAQTAPRQSRLPAPPPGVRSMKSSTSIISNASGTTKTIKTKTVMDPIAPGKYHIPMQNVPRSQQGKFMEFSSPVEMRGRMEQHRGRDVPQVMILPDYRDTQDHRKLMKRPGFEGMQSGSMRFGGSGGSPQAHSTLNDSMFERQLDPSTVGPFSPGSPSSADQSMLAQEVQMKLYRSAEETPDKAIKATGTRQSRTASPYIVTDTGTIPATAEIITSKTIIRSPGRPEIIGTQMTTIESTGGNEAMRTELDIQRIPKKKIPGTAHEIIEVQSSVLMAPGIKQIKRVVSYETDKIEDEEGLPSPDVVLRMVEEEKADIERTKGLPVPELKASRPVTYGLKKNVELLQLNADSISVLEHSLGVSRPNADEEQGEPQPEVLASMLNTEERGLAMGSPPNEVYNYLFSDSKVDPVVDVSSAAPVPLQDIVVPTSIPSQIDEQMRNPEIIQAAMIAQANATEPLNEAAYTSANGLKPIKSKNVARKGKRKKKTNAAVLAEEVPPWGIEDLDPVIDVVGAPPAGTFLATEPDTVEELDPAIDGIEYLLHLEPPNHTSRVQLRGSQKPSWFPGYFFALPEFPEIVQTVKSPSMVFSAAWKATQPDIFSDKSLFIV